MRKLNTLYSIEGESERIIANRTGKPIPLAEPVFILRGRDHLGVTLLRIYQEILKADRSPGYMQNEVKRAAASFKIFADQYPDELTMSGLLHVAEQLKKKYESRLQRVLSEVSLQRKEARDAELAADEKEGLKPLVPIEEIDPAHLSDPEAPLIVDTGADFNEADLPETIEDLDTDEPVDLDS